MNVAGLKAIGREHLDRATCTRPGCDCKSDLMTMESACHTGSPLYVTYQRTTGFITVYCATCREVVSSYALAERNVPGNPAPPPPPPATKPGELMHIQAQFSQLTPVEVAGAGLSMAALAGGSAGMSREAFLNVAESVFDKIATQVAKGSNWFDPQRAPATRH